MEKSKSNYKISILIPVYGVERFIKKCANSLFHQSYQNIEYIFVNDCSKDRSIDVLKRIISKYPHLNDRIKIINHETNKGLSGARNTALLASTGDYIMPFDSDDYISDDNAVQSIVKEIENNDADVVLFNMQHVYKNKTYIPKVTIPESTSDIVKASLKRTIPVCLCGGVYKKSLFTSHGIQSVEGLSMGEDYVVKPRILYYAKKIVYLNKAYYCYLHTNESSYTNSFNFSRITDLSKCMSILRSFFSSVPDSNNYIKDIDIADTQTLSEIYVNWAIGNGNSSDLKKIKTLIPNSCNYANAIGWRNKTIIFLASINSYLLLKYFIRIGARIKQILK